MERVYIKDIRAFIGKEASVSGWVSVRRDQGKMIFFDFRDMTGSLQGVVLPNNKETLGKCKDIRPEWVLKVNGIVNKRPEKNIQKDRENGDVELEIRSVEILNRADTPPIDISGDGHEISEEARLKYRYLDLRRPRMQRNIRNRHKIVKFIRDFLDREGFTEIETPNLTKSTPEGARDYVVPSRLEPGRFYALPQSPQQYKQLLMAAGFEKYFQIARCFRDEDTRADRQPEFTQMDLEMSFADRQAVMALNERLLIEIVTALYPEKKIQAAPFPRLTYKEAVGKYGSDRPDIRADKNDPNLLAFCWVVDFPFFEKDDQGGWTFTHNPFSAPKPEFMDSLMGKKDIGGILTTQYDVVLNGFEIGGGSIRNHRPEALKKVFEIMGYEDDRIESNFGHMLRALSSGTPPHGGIAWGLDRFTALLQGDTSIREVIAFAKTGEGRDLMMESPAEITEKQLKELGIELRKNPRQGGTTKKK